MFTLSYQYWDFFRCSSKYQPSQPEWRLKASSHISQMLVLQLWHGSERVIWSLTNKKSSFSWRSHRLTSQLDKVTVLCWQGSKNPFRSSSSTQEWLSCKTTFHQTTRSDHDTSCSSQLFTILGRKCKKLLLPRVEVVKPGPKQGVFVPIAKGNLALHCELHCRGPTKRNNIKSQVIFGQVDQEGWGWPKTSPYLHSKTLRFDQFQTPQRTAMSCNSWWKSQKGSGVLATCSTPKVREVRTDTSPSNLDSYNPSSSQTSFPCKPATSYSIGALHALAHAPLVQHGWGLGVMSSSKQGPIGTTNRWLLGAKASGRVAGIFPTSQTPYWAKKTARSCHKCRRQWFSFWVFW